MCSIYVYVCIYASTYAPVNESARAGKGEPMYGGNLHFDSTVSGCRQHLCDSKHVPKIAGAV